MNGLAWRRRTPLTERRRPRSSIAAFFLVHLSAADCGKWAELAEACRRNVTQPPPETFSLEEPDYPLVQTVTKSWRPLDPSDEVKIVELYQSGRTTTQLAAQFGVHRTTVSRAVERAGVSLRGIRPTEQQIAEMRRLRDVGETYAAIAREVGFSTQTVRSYVRRR